MAPSKRKTTRASSKNAQKNSKLATFLKEFDGEVQTRLGDILMKSEGFLKEIGDLYNMDLLRMPLALQDMNWLDYFAMGGGQKALEKATRVDPEFLEIKELASAAVQTPIKTVRKAKKVKQDITTIEEEAASAEQPVLPARKRSRQWGDAPEALESQKLGKAKTSIKKVPGSKRSKPPPAKSTRLSRRSSKAKFVTPSGSQAARALALQGATPLLTPKFDSSVFKTPGLRAPAAHERVFSVSANGSPLTDGKDVFITVPAGGGESICLRASELSRRDLMRLNSDTLGSVKKLSAQLAVLCSGLKGAH